MNHRDGNHVDLGVLKEDLTHRLKATFRIRYPPEPPGRGPNGSRRG